MADGSNRMKDMKKILVFISAILLFAACGKSNPDVNVEGSWHLTEISSLKGDVVDVWISFTGNEFSIWQKGPAEDRYSKFNGQFSVNGDKISGKYTDGSSWGDTYKAEKSGDGKTLTLTAGSGEVSTYTKAEVPTTVTSNTYSTKADGTSVERWL